VREKRGRERKVGSPASRLLLTCATSNNNFALVFVWHPQPLMPRPPHQNKCRLMYVRAGCMSGRVYQPKIQCKHTEGHMTIYNLCTTFYFSFSPLSFVCCLGQSFRFSIPWLLLLLLLLLLFVLLLLLSLLLWLLFRCCCCP